MTVLRTNFWYVDPTPFHQAKLANRRVCAGPLTMVRVPGLLRRVLVMLNVEQGSRGTSSSLRWPHSVVLHRRVSTPNFSRDPLQLIPFSETLEASSYFSTRQYGKSTDQRSCVSQTGAP